GCWPATVWWCTWIGHERQGGFEAQPGTLGERTEHQGNVLTANGLALPLPRRRVGVRTLRFLTADVFTSAVFTGNQLAIVFGAEGLRTDTLQAMAREFNYSETVFVFDAENASHTRRVRIFTPEAELPFAGHPTVGTAHALVATGEVPATGNEVTVVLGEGVGPVPVRVTLENGVPVHAQLTTAKLPEERHDVPPIET